MFVLQWGERSREDCGSQIHHGLHLQSVRRRTQSTGEEGGFVSLGKMHEVIFDMWRVLNEMMTL